MTAVLTRSAAEEPLDPSVELTEDSAGGTSVSSETVEGSIRELNGLVNHEELGTVIFDLARLEDLNEQERLHQVLDERIYVDSLRTEIIALQLGPDATVEDLRKRDELFNKIATVRDPDLRYELLGLLEENERLAQDLSVQEDSK